MATVLFGTPGNHQTWQNFLLGRRCYVRDAARVRDSIFSSRSCCSCSISFSKTAIAAWALCSRSRAVCSRILRLASSSFIASYSLRDITCCDGAGKGSREGRSCSQSFSTSAKGNHEGTGSIEAESVISGRALQGRCAPHRCTGTKFVLPGAEAHSTRTTRRTTVPEVRCGAARCIAKRGH